jgi:hypothetical protein
MHFQFLNYRPATIAMTTILFLAGCSPQEKADTRICSVWPAPPSGGEAILNTCWPYGAWTDGCPKSATGITREEIAERCVKKNGYLLARSDGDMEPLVRAAIAACDAEIHSAAADAFQSSKTAFPASSRTLDEFEAMENDRTLKAAQVAVASGRAGKCWLMDMPAVR